MEVSGAAVWGVAGAKRVLNNTLLSLLLLDGALVESYLDWASIWNYPSRAIQKGTSEPHTSFWTSIFSQS